MRSRFSAAFSFEMRMLQTFGPWKTGEP